MKKLPLFQTENRVRRTYRGGRLLDAFLGRDDPKDSFCPEDWISSFVEAKNKSYISGEGISRVLLNRQEIPITEAVSKDDFGPGRKDSGVLVKLLNSSERLGIQVHPTPDFSRKHWGTDYGKTECWHILKTEPDAAVYIGFKAGITRQRWAELFAVQDIDGMLSSLHRLNVSAGDTILVRAGTPHAIDAGCFLLEIQEPTDYTMRVEKTTVTGDSLTPEQIHYGVGEEALLDCFIYQGLTEQEARTKYFILPRATESRGVTDVVTYDDTPCFALQTLKTGGSIWPDSFVTLVVTSGGALQIGDTRLKTRRGDKIFVPHGCGRIFSDNAEAIICYPPKI